jgi:hypothetical protein
MTKEQLHSHLEDYEEEILLADGFEDAYMGIGRQFTKPPFAVYDRAKCIEILSSEMSEEEAEEYFQYNVEGAWVGENTPVFIEPLKLNKELEKLEDTKAYKLGFKNGLEEGFEDNPFEKDIERISYSKGYDEGVSEYSRWI